MGLAAMIWAGCYVRKLLRQEGQPKKTGCLNGCGDMHWLFGGPSGSVVVCVRSHDRTIRASRTSSSMSTASEAAQ
eukprot:COSAG01_NODE_6051_length_3879_cov_1.779365_4_plen_75_part_00